MLSVFHLSHSWSDGMSYQPNIKINNAKSTWDIQDFMNFYPNLLVAKSRLTQQGNRTQLSDCPIAELSENAPRYQRTNKLTYRRRDDVPTSQRTNEPSHQSLPGRSIFSETTSFHAKSRDSGTGPFHTILFVPGPYPSPSRPLRGRAASFLADEGGAENTKEGRLL